MLIAQFTDTHVVAHGARASGTVDSNARLAAAVDQLNRLHPRPDCLLVTGDLTDSGAVEEYRVARSLLDRVEMPVYVGIGNHDHRETMLAELDRPEFAALDEFVHYVVDDHPVRLVMLDSVSAEHHLGEFCEARRQWLAERLAEDPDTPTLVAVHHPPVDTGITVLDAAGPGWAEGLLATLGASTNVGLVTSGHVHRSIQAVVDGLPINVCPSTAHQTTLDLAAAPSAAHLFTLEPGAFQVHRWADGRFTTHTVPIGDWEGVLPTSPEARARFADADPRELFRRRPRP
jgi:Icc protein